MFVKKWNLPKGTIVKFSTKWTDIYTMKQN